MISRIWRKISVLGAAGLGLLAAATPVLSEETPGARGTITATFVSRNDSGTVRCSLYASADGYPTDPSKALAKLDVPIVHGRSVCAFHDIAPGTYAIAGFHDENDNRVLDMGFLGIPKEGTGASRNAPQHFSPPSFEDAKFVYRGGDVRLQTLIEMVYH